MQRVLEVVYGLGYGGIRACIQNYISNINHTEFKVDIYAYGVSDSPFKQKFESMGCTVFLEPKNDIIIFADESRLEQVVYKSPTPAGPKTVPVSTFNALQTSSISYNPLWKIILQAQDR